MAYKRFLVEFGTGADLHGMDVTKAAKRAVSDAMSHCCLCGLHDIFDMQSPAESMRVDIRVFSPEPEKVDAQAVAGMVRFGQKEIRVLEGGATGQGLHVSELGQGDTIAIANAVLTVWVDVQDAPDR